MAARSAHHSTTWTPTLRSNAADSVSSGRGPGQCNDSRTGNKPRRVWRSGAGRDCQATCKDALNLGQKVPAAVAANEPADTAVEVAKDSTVAPIDEISEERLSSQTQAVENSDDIATKSKMDEECAASTASKSGGCTDLVAEDEEAAMFLNTCYLCGETHMLIADLGNDFTCEFAGVRCAGVEEDADAIQATPSAAQDAKSNQPSTASQPLDLRTRILLRAAEEKLSVFETARLFLENGLDPQVGEDEIENAVADVRAKQKKLDVERERQSRSRPSERYLDGHVVQLKNGSRFLQEDKETKEQKASTSVSIRILGNHTGQGSAKEKKKGPRS
mmetsp:Transcript_41978/g.98505  ORF Transcript_41978/g.98505 Transcript_41978/m.98505 type:complete len:332 (-) Transcript_41978:103-1098(-)